MCLLLILVSVLNVIPIRQSLGNKVNYSEALGTNKAINVPLVNENFTTDNYNKWDMQCFALFLSNFTVPFIDNYESAFTEGKGGSDGAGALALQFAAGGDVDSGDALNQMIQWVLQTAKKTALKPINTKLFAYDGNVMNKDITAKTESRPATIRDLFISCVALDDYSDYDTWTDIGDDQLPYTFLVTSDPSLVETSIPKAQIKATKNTSGYLNYGYMLTTKANLPVFFLGKYDEAIGTKDGCENVVWDMTDGWDNQMWAAILNYVYTGANEKVAYGIEGTTSMDVTEATTEADEDGQPDPDGGAKVQDGDTSTAIQELIAQMLTNYGSYPLYFDCFGNICIQDKGKTLIIIPAVMNKNLTVDKRVNLVVSPIINSYLASANDITSMFIGGTNELIERTSDLSSNFGGSSITSLDGAVWNGASIKDQKGKLIAYETTDYYATEELYKGKFWESNDLYSKSYTDIGYVDKLKKFAVTPHQTGINDAYIRIESMGASDETYWGGTDGQVTSGVNKVKDFQNLKMPSIMVRNYTACQLISYMFPFGADNTPMLDYIYEDSGERVKSSIFGKTVYASPGVNGSSNNGDGSANFIKYYIDNYFHILGDTNLINNPFNNASMGLSGDTMLKQLNTCTDIESLLSCIFIGSSSSTTSSISGETANVYLSHLLCTSPRFGLEKDKKTAGNYQKVVSNLTLNALANSIDDDLINNFDVMGASQLNADTCAQSIRSVAKVYSGGGSLSKAASYLGLLDGTDFAAAATWIYLTYLDFYGIIGTDGTDPGNFVEVLFKDTINAVNVEEMFSGMYMTTEQKKEEVLNYSYLMLSPDAGRKYRNSIVSTGLTDWVYTQYTKICYGTSDTEKYQSLLSTGAEGFLHIYSYEDNFMTSWIVNNYAKAVMWGLLILSMILVIYGLIKQLKFGWFAMSVITLTIMFVMAPSAGEITPYICEKMVNQMFSVGSSHWALSETIDNLTLEQSVADEEEDDGKSLLTWVSMLRTSQMNKTILLKKDISKKIVEATVYDYTEIQKLASTRWLLPAFMRQIRDDKDNYDYVYTTLAEQFQMGTDCYLYYNSSDETMGYGNRAVRVKDGSTSALESELARGVGELISEYKKPFVSDASNYLMMDTRISVDGGSGYWAPSKLPFSNTAYYKDGVTGAAGTKNKVHTVMYIVNGVEVTNSGGGTASSSIGGQILVAPTDFRKIWYSKTTSISSKGVSYWDDYAGKVVEESKNTSSQVVNKFGKMTDGMLLRISDYNHNSDEPTSMFSQSFGYLLTTENLGAYFYSLVKDTFFEETSTKTLAFVISQLQGGTVPVNVDTDGDGIPDKTNGYVRKSFMHMGDTGWTKDVLDLREVFTNVIPYMYQMQVNALGTDNGDGLLKDAKFGDEYPIYSEAQKSWLYRSNWVTKLMEAKDYREPTTVVGYKSYTMKNGEFVPVGEKVEYTIQSPLLPQSYPGSTTSFDGLTGESGEQIPYNSGSVVGYRPMIFSEAQMKMLGLSEGDLSRVELACVKANKDIVNQWTLLINYANKAGVTKEALYRIMSIRALLAFNQAFNTDNFISATMNLYPTELDLRNVSFDAVMKLVVMSNSNTQLYSNDTAMRTIIDEGGFWNGLLVLITAALCNSVIPFVRTLVMGIVFYAGIISALWNTIRSKREKGMMLGGTFMCHAAICVVTVAYYFIYYAFITVASNEEVLSINKITADTSVPTMKILAIVVGSLLYLAFLVIFTWKLLRNIKDMGFGVFRSMGVALLNGVNRMAGSVGDKVSNYFGGDSSTSYSSSSNVSADIDSSEKNPVNVKVVGDSKVAITNNNSFDKEIGHEDGDSGYMMDGGVRGANNVREFNIDQVIEEGSHRSEAKQTGDSEE